ncbi:MAG: uracil-DNA glycosylase [Inhella sp.]|uniref:uracil-DNA glycosylase n=1 Tax=Inhella sp. TaxID=1921806 RepID=UPI00391FC9C0
MSTPPRWTDRQLALLAALGVRDWWPLPPTAPEAEPQPKPEPQSEAVAAPAEAVRPPPPPAPALPQAEPAPLALTLDAEGLNAAIRACRACGLCEGRRQAVPGVGALPAPWLVVGEAPGEQEDAQGEPFVGPAGQLLDAMLAAMGLDRRATEPAKQVYIANAVKCRPPRNRAPEADELAACRPYLWRQIELVNPRLVLVFGKVAAQTLLGTDEALGKLRGRVHRLPDGRPAVVTYHPAYLLRQPQDKLKAWEDLCLALDTAEALP